MNLAYPFGKDKPGSQFGKPLSEVPNKSLEFLIKACSESLNDPEKAKFSARNRELINAAKSILIARLNGEPGPAPKPAPMIKGSDIQEYDSKTDQYTLKEDVRKHFNPPAPTSQSKLGEMILAETKSTKAMVGESLTKINRMIAIIERSLGNMHSQPVSDIPGTQEEPFNDQF